MGGLQQQRTDAMRYTVQPRQNSQSFIDRRIDGGGRCDIGTERGNPQFSAEGSQLVRIAAHRENSASRGDQLPAQCQADPAGGSEDHVSCGSSFIFSGHHSIFPDSERVNRETCASHIRLIYRHAGKW